MSIKKVARIEAEIYAVKLNSFTDIEEVQKRFDCNLERDCTLSGREVYIYTTRWSNKIDRVPYGSYLVRENGMNSMHTPKEFKKRFKVLE